MNVSVPSSQRSDPDLLKVPAPSKIESRNRNEHFSKYLDERQETHRDKTWTDDRGRSEPDASPIERRGSQRTDQPRNASQDAQPREQSQKTEKETTTRDVDTPSAKAENSPPTDAKTDAADETSAAQTGQDESTTEESPGDQNEKLSQTDADTWHKGEQETGDANTADATKVAVTDQNVHPENTTSKAETGETHGAPRAQAHRAHPGGETQTAAAPDTRQTAEGSALPNQRPDTDQAGDKPPLEKGTHAQDARKILGKQLPSLGQQAAEKFGSDASKNTTSQSKETQTSNTAKPVNGLSAAKFASQTVAAQQAASSALGDFKFSPDSQNTWTSQGLEQVHGSSTQASNPILLRVGALPGQAQASQIPTTAIALQISKHLQKGVNRFEIRLDPPELGRMDVRMEVSMSGKVIVHLVVERAETLDLVQRDARALAQALEDAGLDPDSDTLNFSLKDEQESSTTEGDTAQQNAQNTSGAEIEEEPGTAPSQHLIYTSDQGVDIRI